MLSAVIANCFNRMFGQHKNVLTISAADFEKKRKENLGKANINVAKVMVLCFKYTRSVRIV